MKNILVFPCGSEIGLEVHRSLKYSRHIKLFGASSVSDHGRFVYESYIEGLPYANEKNFLAELKKVVDLHKIDAIYPAMDSVAATIKEGEEYLGCKVVGSSYETNAICRSKIATYTVLTGVVPIASWSETASDNETYPLFIKPDFGYGSRNTYVAADNSDVQHFLARNTDKEFVFCEYLPGREYTIDCFSDRHQQLLFCGARGRERIQNGISVGTKEEPTAHNFRGYAEDINRILKPRGAWFFQMKEDHQGRVRLLEVAARLGGSSGLYRGKGVNFALLSVFDAFDIDVEVRVNNYRIAMDRALNNKYKIDLSYSCVYVDYDDCLLINGVVNTEIVALIYKSINDGKKVKLITRHQGDLYGSLRSNRLLNLFDEIIHITDGKAKSDYIDTHDGIFIDDSFSERQGVFLSCGMPVFSPDMIEIFL